MVIELRVVQFWSEIILVISNQTRAARSFDFEITRMISDQIALHSVQLPILTERTQSVKAPPNVCSVIQHCWTIMSSVEQGNQTNETCLLQHLNSRVWDQNLPRILRKQTRAIFDLPKKWRETDQPPRRTIFSLFLVSTVLLTPLSFLFLFEETSIVLKLSSLIEIQTLFVRYTGGSS